MADLFINMNLSKWTKRSFHVQTQASRGETVEDVLRRSTGLYDAVTEGGVDIEFLRENLGSYLEEAFSTEEPRCFSKVYGDDEPDGTDWRLYIDGITQAELERRDEILQDVFKRNERSDALTRMVRLDEHLGLIDDEVPAR